MSKRLVVVATALLCLGAVTFFWLATRDAKEYRNFRAINEGMSHEDVQAVLGPGKEVLPTAIPEMVVAVSSEDERRIDESSRVRGVVPSARDYTTRLKRVVEGDVYYIWESPSGTIYIAFKDGKVSGKHFQDLSSF